MILLCCLQSYDFLLKFDVIALDVLREQFEELGQIESYISVIGPRWNLVFAPRTARNGKSNESALLLCASIIISTCRLLYELSVTQMIKI